MNIDKLNSMSSHKVQTSAFKLLDAVQRLPNEEQLAAACFMFLLISKRYSLDPRQMMHWSERVFKDSLSEGRGEQARAIINYLEGEF
jgi:hypothetical protein